MNLQEKVFNALAAALNVPVVKYENEYTGDYPVAVFDEIENVPAIFADNVELLKKITYKVSIGTENDCYEDIEILVESAMKNLGFKRVEATETFDKVFWREIKFVIFTEENKNV